jgi:PAS domain S-box-containing protein
MLSECVEYSNPSCQRGAVYNPEGRSRPSEEGKAVFGILENTPLLISAMDGSNRILLWNRQCELTTGYSAGEVIGSQNAFEKLYPDRKYRRELLESWRKSRFEFSEHETWLTCKNGDQKKINWSGLAESVPIPTFRSLIIGTDINTAGRQVNSVNNHLANFANSKQRLYNWLSRNSEKMETMIRELTETNQALSALASNIEKEKEDIKKKLHQAIHFQILPILRQIHNSPNFWDYKTGVDCLSKQISALKASLQPATKPVCLLSSAESQIATLIICGMTSQEIADHLSVSLDTVKTHRKNIRKKFKIQNKSINLHDFLRRKL